MCYPFLERPIARRGGCLLSLLMKGGDAYAGFVPVAELDARDGEYHHRIAFFDLFHSEKVKENAYPACPAE